MKPIRRHRTFEKHFRSRVSPNQKLEEQFKQRLSLFVKGERNYPLFDHPLGGNMKGLRSFSVASDLRVVYRETEENYEFLDIGSHNQVY